MFLFCSVICAGNVQGRGNTCGGYPGGPLVEAPFFLVGITSWGAGCGKPNLPVVYSNVLAARGWIEGITGHLYY